jgi:hypothetical protein
MKTLTKGGIIQRFTKVSEEQIDFDINTFTGEEMKFSLFSKDPEYTGCICIDNKITMHYDPIKIENTDRFRVVRIETILFFVGQK